MIAPAGTEVDAISQYGGGGDPLDRLVIFGAFGAPNQTEYLSQIRYPVNRVVDPPSSAVALGVPQAVVLGSAPEPAPGAAAAVPVATSGFGWGMLLLVLVAYLVLRK